MAVYKPTNTSREAHLVGACWKHQKNIDYISNINIITEKGK